MLERKLRGKVGEFFVGSIFDNLGFEVDIIDGKGIDLACYKDDIKYGISVKTRNIEEVENNNLNLGYNDIVYAYDESKKRGLSPLYAILFYDLSRIDVLIMTQEYTFMNYFSKKDGIGNIEDYKKVYPHKNVIGATKFIGTSLKARENWKFLKDEEGIIFTASYRITE